MRPLPKHSEKESEETTEEEPESELSQTDSAASTSDTKQTTLFGGDY